MLFNNQLTLEQLRIQLKLNPTNSNTHKEAFSPVIKFPLITTLLLGPAEKQSITHGRQKAHSKESEKPVRRKPTGLVATIY